MTRFELATPATRTRCATRLRYIPTILDFQMFHIFKSALPPLMKQFTGLFHSAECYIPIFYVLLLLFYYITSKKNCEHDCNLLKKMLLSFYGYY